MMQQSKPLSKTVGLVCAAFSLVAGVVGCQTAGKHPEKAIERDIVDNEKTLSEQLTAHIEKKFKRSGDRKLEGMLEGFARLLCQGDPGYRDLQNQIHVHVLDADRGLAASGFAGEIYLSKRYIGTVQFENELAYLMAHQLVLLKERATAGRYAQMNAQDFGESLMALPTLAQQKKADPLAKEWFEPGGLFDYGNKVYLKAEIAAIELMYKSQFDARGAVTWIQKSIDHAQDSEFALVGKILPEAEDRISFARETVAKLSPLRNPIVKSAGFDELLRKIKTKKAKKGA